MEHTPDYRAAVIRYAEAYAAAMCDQDRDDAHADFLAALVLLHAYGPRERQPGSGDPVAERILAARYGERVH